MSELGGEGSGGAGEPGSSTSPRPASGQAAIPAPRGPVTGLSRVAGVIILLSGIGLTALGGWLLMDQSSEWEGPVLSGLPALLAGIGILRGAEWGRGIGIVYSLLWSPYLVFWALLLDQPIPALFFVLSAYSAVVLMFRWRRPATP